MNDDTVITLIILIVLGISIALACCFVLFAEDITDNSRVVEESYTKKDPIFYNVVHANEI